MLALMQQLLCPASALGARPLACALLLLRNHHRQQQLHKLWPAQQQRLLLPPTVAACSSARAHSTGAHDGGAGNGSGGGSSSSSGTRNASQRRSSRQRSVAEADGGGSAVEQPGSFAAAAPPPHASSSSVHQADEEVEAAVARLGRFLDFRERCASEVLQKLAALGYSRDVSQRALQALQRAGLQDDGRFADMFVRGYWRTKGHAPARLAYELRARGVAQQHISAALAGVFGDAHQLPAREAGNEQEEASWQHLLELCRQRAQLSAGEPQQKRRHKLAQWLQRRGHSLGTAFRVIDELRL